MGGLVASLYKNKRTRKFVLIPLVIIGLGLLVPQKMIIPVQGAGTSNWDVNSFWAYPWGTSITHKGIDIFDERGTNVISATHGIVMYTSEGGKGGKAVMILGPKWRFHYYAHLDEFDTHAFSPVSPGAIIGTVGDSGNAIGKPTHLHYAISSPFPHWWLYDGEAVPRLEEDVLSKTR